MYMSKYRVKGGRRNCDGRFEEEAMEFQGCALGSRKSCHSQDQNAVKTLLVLQKDLSDQHAFLPLQNNSNYVTAV